MKIRNRFLIRTIARCGAVGFRMLYATCRRHILEAQPQTAPYQKLPKHFIHCGYHDNILSSLFCGRPKACAALTSRHADGDFIAEILVALGLKPIRGSHNHGGAGAGKLLIDSLKDYNIYITTDGPRGPRRQVKPGVVFIASLTGHEIVPVANSATKAWYPRGRWTDLMIPKPFSTSYTLLGEPMSVPAGLSKEQLVPFTAELQRRMDELQEHADKLARGEAVTDFSSNSVLRSIPDQVSKAA